MSADDPTVTAPLLTRIDLPDQASAWESLGFADDAGRIEVGTVALTLGAPTTRLRWSGGIEPPTHLCGIECARDDRPEDEAPRAVAPRHPNGVTSIDHVVIAANDALATQDDLDRWGMTVRRRRTATAGGRSVEQWFVRSGPTVLEFVIGDLPAGLWGLAFEADDLDALSTRLGHLVGAPRPAVQPDRRIATARTRDLAISVTVAFMGADV